jgi:RHS repeat-associated protein
MYDYVGNRTIMQVTDSGGTRNHVYSYDSIYQLTDVNYPVGYDYLATDTTFNYDATGNRTSVIDGGGNTSYVTNALNQYTSVGNVQYLYDKAGNLTYDGGNNMYAYDPENRLMTVTRSPNVFSAACDTPLTLTGGGTGTWSAQTSVYCPDPDGDNDAVQSPDIGDNQSTYIETTVEGEGTLKYWWKVSSESGDTMVFILDGQVSGSRSGDSGWEQRTHTITGSGTHTFRWRYTKDPNGSAGDDCMWLDHIEWTPTNPPSGGDWNEITYVYDPAGRRIEKKYDGDTQVKYFYDGDHCIAEYDANDALLRKYIYGPGIDQPICMTEVADNNAVFYYHFDGLGSVIALTNSSGSVVNLYEYSVFGEVSASDPNHPNRFLFTGREFDADTGLYYYRARYYNPYIARFLQTDPAGYGMNPFTYCSNSPINRIDPEGLDDIWGGSCPGYNRSVDEVL